MGVMGVVQLAEYLNLKPRWLDGTNIGGSSFVGPRDPRGGGDPRRALRGRADPLRQHGGLERDRDRHRPRRRGRDPAAAFVGPYGLTTVGSYALVARRHMERYGTTPEQLAEIAVTMRRHAGLNPDAKMRRPIDGRTTCSRAG